MTLANVPISESIGGEMPIAPRELWMKAKGKFPVKNRQLVLSGRTALRAILHALGKKGSRKIALPSYLCESLLDPLREEGFKPVFYGVDENLNIYSTGARAMVEAERPAALLFINYFGFPPDEETQKTLRALKAKCLIIEDCVQGSWLESKPANVGHIGDFVFTSFRKYLPLPDGGLLLNRSKFTIPPLPTGRSRVAGKVFLGKLMRSELQDSETAVREYLHLFAEAERELAQTVPLERCSTMTENLLPAIALAPAMKRRRANFRHLLKAFTTQPRLRRAGQPIFTRLPSRVSPLFFPIRTTAAKRDPLRKALQARNIFCPVHWPLPAAVDKKKFPEAHRLSAEILCLPIDQRYTNNHMKTLLTQLIAADSSL